MSLLFTLLLFEDISGGELLIILLAIFLFFGPNKIPEIAKTLAKGIQSINKATGSIKEDIGKNIAPIKKELQNTIETFKEELKVENTTEESSIKPEETKNKFSG